MLGYVDGVGHGGKGVASAGSSSGTVLHNPDEVCPDREGEGGRGGRGKAPSPGPAHSDDDRVCSC